MIVVDLGSLECGEAESVEKLIERFSPSIVYAFDPWPLVWEPALAKRGPVATVVGGVPVVSSVQAAWVYDGLLGWTFDRDRPTVSRVDEFSDEEVRCFDFSAWLTWLPEKPVVKMDIEGAELEVLPHVCEQGTDVLIDLLLVEWHVASLLEKSIRDDVLASIRCEVEEWEA